MRTRNMYDIGRRELDIMQILWRVGKATVAGVHEELVGSGNDVAYTTVQTMLNRLEAKGLVARDSSDRAHRYKPLLKEKAVVGSAIQSLTRRFFRGSKEALASHLVEKDFTPEQLDRLQSLIDKRRREESRK